MRQDDHTRIQLTTVQTEEMQQEAIDIGMYPSALRCLDQQVADRLMCSTAQEGMSKYSIEKVRFPRTVRWPLIPCVLTCLAQDIAQYIKKTVRYLTSNLLQLASNRVHSSMSVRVPPGIASSVEISDLSLPTRPNTSSTFISAIVRFFFSRPNDIISSSVHFRYFHSDSAVGYREMMLQKQL